MSKYYIIGTGGHASVIVDILKSNNIEIEGFFDDYDSDSKYGYPIIGKIADAVAYCNSSNFIIAVGDNQARRIISNKLEGLNFNTALHTSVVIGSNILLGSGTVLFPNVVVNAGTIIGKHVIINSGAVVEHDCIIGNYVHVSPRAVLCGGVQVADNTWIGAGAVIIPKIKIGRNVIVGAGAVVIRDIPDGMTVIGVPSHKRSSS